MKNFIFNIPTKVHFGRGEIKRLPKAINTYGSNVLLVFGGGSIKRNGMYDQVMELLPDNTIYELSGVDPNPRIETVREGVEICRENDIDVILAVGGGSVIDCAKMISVGAKYDGDAWEIVENRTLIDGSLPLVTILTLSATGTEMNFHAVTTNFEIKEKLGTSHVELFPNVSILDPSFTFSVPPYQTAAGAADTISHTLENYFNEENSAYLTDSISEAILKTVIKYIPIALAEPDNYEARANLMWASSMALNGINAMGKGGRWSCHPIEHYLSAYYDITHAVGLAILTPRWMIKVLNEDTVDHFKRYASNVWNIPEQEDKFAMATEAIHKTYNFFKENGLPMTLPEVGIDEEYFDEIATRVEPKLENVYVPLNREDVVEILTNCMTEGF